MPALQRAVALAEVDGVALAVAEHLDLDVARLLQILLDVDGIVVERGLGFGARRRRAPSPRSAALVATFMPRPPPPAVALIRTGKPMSLATFIASVSLVIAPSEPGTTGMPRLLAVSLASILSPMMRMCSDVGPMKVILCSSRISAKRAFSDRKP